MRFAGAGAFLARAYQGHHVAIRFAGVGSLFLDTILPSVSPQEMALIGTIPPSTRFVQCDIMTKATRYMYIFYGRQMHPAEFLQLFFRGPDNALFVAKYPDVQVGVIDRNTCKGFFPAKQYVTVKLSVSRLLSQAGVWEVSSMHDGPGQKFYVSAVD